MKVSISKKLLALFTLLLLLCLNLNLIQVNAATTSDAITVFDKKSNEWNAQYFRIPSLQTLKDGTMLAFSDIRYNGPKDHGFIDIGVAKSTDGGETWDYQIAMKNDRKNETFSRVMDSTTVVTNTGRIILIAGSWNTDGSWATKTSNLRSDWSVQMVYSDDNGETWSPKIDLTTNKAKITNQPKNTIGWLGGVGTGIVLSDNTIIIPAQITIRENGTNNYYSTFIYSKDDGNSWTMGAKVPDKNTSENMIIELDGKLIMSSRYDGTSTRAAYILEDLDGQWKEYAPLHKKIATGKGSGCQGSFIKVTAPNGDRIGLISAPQNLLGDYIRDNITVYMINFDSEDKKIEKLTIPYPKAGNKAGAGYSSLSFNNNTLSIIYEADGNIEYKDLTSNYLSINSSKVDYLSDIDFKSELSYGKVGLDIAHDLTNKLSLKLDNDTNTTYHKGVGIHSNGKITIDLNNKNYKTFKAEVGLLQKDGVNNPYGSIEFKFYLDGELVKETNTMNYSTPKKDISFDVTGKSQLRIVISDARNSIGGDWGVLGNARFIK